MDGRRKKATKQGEDNRCRRKKENRPAEKVLEQFTIPNVEDSPEYKTWSKTVQDLQEETRHMAKERRYSRHRTFVIYLVNDKGYKNYF